MIKIEVSVIVPVYNSEKFIGNLINCVLMQGYPYWELILVNDGSSDNSETIIKPFCEQDDRIKLINQNNEGPSSARNAGIEIAKGEYITFIDADDAISNTYIIDLLTPFKINSEIDLVCGGYYELNDRFPKGIPLHDFKAYFPEKVIGQKEFQNNIFKGVTGVLWGKMFKKVIILQNEIRLPLNIKLSEDLLFILDYSKYIKQVALVYKESYYYNRTGGSRLSGKLNATYFSSIGNFNNQLVKKINGTNIIGIDNIINERTGDFFAKMLNDNIYDKNQFYIITGYMRKQFNLSTIAKGSKHSLLLTSINNGNIILSQICLIFRDLISKIIACVRKY